MIRSIRLTDASEMPFDTANSTDGSSQNLASPSGEKTCTCWRASSREKKKKRNCPSRNTVGLTRKGYYKQTAHTMNRPGFPGELTVCVGRSDHADFNHPEAGRPQPRRKCCTLEYADTSPATYASSRRDQREACRRPGRVRRTLEYNYHSRRGLQLSRAYWR